ncbi:MAG: SDR family NAD(P)-dependent oxidoreductase [Polyangiaceae bacterium]
MSEHQAIAIVGVGAIMPDAPDAKAFWGNIRGGRYSISDVTADRWDPALYYDVDPKAPDKTYSKIGGWVRSAPWDPMAWKLAIPPRVVDAMDEGQRWAVAATREALADYGYPNRALDLERTAVILGNAMGGEKHYRTTLRASFPEYADWLSRGLAFGALPEATRRLILDELANTVGGALPPITEDSMPGELSNCIAGRIANIFNLHGPNFTCDAACASALAAISAAREGLIEGDFDAVITGGVDRNMSASTFVKFCKIGALSATGTRPFADGADGFVMGEGAAIFILKRLADAERAGDRIYAVLRGMAGSSDGKGKGITAPNPVGQKLAVARAWADAGVSIRAGALIEAHGTSTKVGDVVEVGSLTDVLGPGLAHRSVALGSVKSNIGHLKGAAGAAGLFKAVMSLHEKVLPPSLGFKNPNPNIDFSSSPFYVNQELCDWSLPNGDVRQAAVSAFGFGGTNFHVVLEEHREGRLTRKAQGRGFESVPRAEGEPLHARAPLRGIALVTGSSSDELARGLEAWLARAKNGVAPPPAPPSASELRAPERIAVDYGDPNELAEKLTLAKKALASGGPAWKPLRARGIFYGKGPSPKVAFLYPGQGSQYVNMLAGLAREPEVHAVFEEADRVMAPKLGRPLTEILFADPTDSARMQQADEELRQTAVTQPAVLAVDAALTRLLASYGVVPDLVMGHSLGEYGALVAAEALPFADALEAVAARGKEMTAVSLDDNGKMAAVMGPYAEIERVLASVRDYVVIANINSSSQVVIGGSSAGVDAASQALLTAGFQVIPLPVSHAFHTSIVAPASEPLRRVLERLRLAPPKTPVVANVDGELYPAGSGAVDEMLDILARQVAEPVQFVKGLERAYAEGVRLFVEVGPKRALQGFAEDVLGAREGVLALYTNHPKLGDAVSFNQALAGLYASGLGATRADARPSETTPRAPAPVALRAPVAPVAPAPAVSAPELPRAFAPSGGAPPYAELGRMFAEFVERTHSLIGGGSSAPSEPIVVSGAALGLPGTPHVFESDAVARLLHGEQLIDVIPTKLRKAMLDKHITRLVKKEGKDPVFEAIDNEVDVIKLAGRGGAFDLTAEYGVPKERVEAFDITTQLAFAAGLDALRDAGIPLVPRYKTTSKGTLLPDGWALPEPMRDDTGIVFASAFPGYDHLIGQLTHFFEDRARRDRLVELQSLRARTGPADGNAVELDRRIHELEVEIQERAFTFDRRFLFQVLAMGHSQFAEYIRARGPNTQVNSACASTTQAINVAEDWIRLGRCRRVIVVAADDITSDTMLGWFASGFLATGAAATEEVVEEVATPFDRRRHGMLVGMGAAALVLESKVALAERGIAPITELLGTITANSAFHGTRLDVEHISGIMESLVASVERRFGIGRAEMASRMVFVSHETYTPARGGSAAAEIFALRRVFGAHAERIVIANTKGFTGHAMGAGIEDVLAVKSLETGIVPPVPNFKEVDPELGVLNLSQGGSYPVEFALRLGAGFGSQISMTLMRRGTSGPRAGVHALGFEGRIQDRARFQSWLGNVSGEASPTLEVVQRTLRIKDSRMTSGARGRAPEAPSAVRAAAVPEAKPRAAAPAPPTPPPAAPVPSAPARDEVAERVLALVADKTGYPRDMLALDLDLEADLGIDTVKQAEVFASIRSAYDIPRDDQLKLRDYPTLAHVIEFVRSRRPDLGAPVAKPVAAPAPAAFDEVTERVLALVAEKTGYPRDMLDLDLDLEADLGIDTVKQAEVFASIRSAYDIPRDDQLKLRDYPTLKHVVRFVEERRQKGPAPALAEVSGRAASPSAAAAYPRRVPLPVLRPDLSVCKPTGVELAPGARVIVVCDAGPTGALLGERLRARGVEVLEVAGEPSGAELLSQARAFLAQGAVTGVYFLSTLEVEPELWALDPAAWKSLTERRVKAPSHLMRELHAGLGAGRFFVSATRMGGLHGYGRGGAASALGGALSGFTKALARERAQALVKCVDFELEAGPEGIAEQLVHETLRDPGAVEVGIAGGRRFSVGFEVRTAAAGGGLTLDANCVYVVTGAAGSITSAITRDLASSGGTFWLLDLTPEPPRQSPDLDRLASDREGLKRELFERAKARGERATPATVEQEVSRLERAQAARMAIRAVEERGGRADWRSLDLRDADRVREVVDEIRRAHGRVDVLVHAAGIEISRSLPDKSPAEFDLVWDVKCDGAANLLRALEEMPLGAFVAFSSIAGRFGNRGQTDYSSANDFLCKLCSKLAQRGVRAVAIDWTAWAEIGMASRGSIPTIMAAAGIDMLPPAVGVPIVRRELETGAPEREIIAAGSLGLMLEERAPEGGIEPGAYAGKRLPMLGRVLEAGQYAGLVVEAELDPTRQRFLDDHRIEGVPVLPGVMGLEAFAEAALLLAPDAVVRAIENVEFLAPFKFYRDEPRRVRVEVAIHPEREELVGRARLLGTRTLADGKTETKLHFSADVRLSTRGPEVKQSSAPTPSANGGVGRDAIYRIYFHGPAYRVIDKAWRAEEGVTAELATGLPPNHDPPELPLAAAPRLIEACFQTAGVWEIGTTGRMGLPQHIDRVEVSSRATDLGGALFATAAPRDGGFDAVVVDAEGHVLVSLSGYRTAELPAPIAGDLLSPLSSAMR